MRSIISLTILSILAACGNDQSTESPAPAAQTGIDGFDVILAGGTVVDGLGNQRFNADVGIRADRIVAVSTSGLAGAEAEAVIDVSGLIVAPGFIDNHAHIQTTIHEYPLAENFHPSGDHDDHCRAAQR